VEITQEVIWPAVPGEGAWFQPRVCSLADERLLMTCQRISADDGYGSVHMTTSSDNGHTWSVPEPVPPFPRRKVAPRDEEGEWEEAVCDVVPSELADGRILLIGQNVWYRDGVLASPNDNRCSRWAISDNGKWSDGVIEWDDARCSRGLYAGCAQRIHLDDGNILLPVSHASADGLPRGVCVLKLNENMQVIRAGPSLHYPAKRGLLEPTIVAHDGMFHMTIRAEDGRGWHTTSTDGMHWKPIEAWRFSDGSELVTDSTQQRWLIHRDKLHLVYTRKHECNQQLMRWRAPLWIAEVTDGKLSGEMRLLPADGEPLERLGNFSTLSGNTSLVFATEARPEHEWSGRTLLARIN
jgi:hypothetical protein